jgi:site-specific recombinase XerC
MNLREAADDFVKAKEIENLSGKTLQTYKSMTYELADYLENIPLDAFSAMDVHNFLNYLRNRNGRFGKLSDATIHKYFSVVRTFSRWLKEQDYMDVSPTAKVNAPRVEMKLPECL